LAEQQVYLVSCGAFFFGLTLTAAKRGRAIFNSTWICHEERIKQLVINTNDRMSAFKMLGTTDEENVQ
jgi:hypothetical protein